MTIELASLDSHVQSNQSSTLLPWFAQAASHTSQAGSVIMPRLSAGDWITTNLYLWCRDQPILSLRFEPTVFENALGRNLIENALIRTLANEARVTTTCQQVSLRWNEGPVKVVRVKSGRKRTLHDQTTAQVLVAKVQSLSGLTLEEIAPLVGVSRRSIQNWRAQRRISARKEQRLRDIADVLNLLSFSNAAEARRKLLDRVPENVRPYDLLAEGRFVAAYRMITGAAAVPANLEAEFKTELSPAESLVARLSNRDDGPPFKAQRVDLSRSKRLKR
jgi:hypothetical protein